MGGTMKLTRLYSLSETMLKKDLDYQVINGIRYKTNLELSAIFKYDYKDIKNKKYDEASEKTYVLGLFKRGTKDFIELPLIYEVNDEYKSFKLPLLSPEDDLYHELRKFLEINYTKHGAFKPIDFYRALHNAIPTKANENNLDRRVCSYSYPTSKDNEHEKIYFLGFLNNDLKENKRSLENKAKTEKLLPVANKVIGERNISVRFTDTPKEINKEIKEINDKINEV